MEKSVEEIAMNHQKFKTSSNPLEKLHLAWKNTMIQLNLAKESLNKIKDMASEMGYNIDENTGQLKKKQ